MPAIYGLVVCQIVAIWGQDSPPAQTGPKKGSESLAAIRPFAQNDNRRDQILAEWQKRAEAVPGLRLKLTRTLTDPVDRSTIKSDVEAKFLRPDHAMIEGRTTGSADEHRGFVLTPDRWYLFNSSTKTLWIIESLRFLPRIQPETEFLKLLGSINAEDAKRRYDIVLAKEDQHYAYLFITPRTQSDREAFSKARLVLWNTTFLPRQLEIEQPNGVVKWEIPRKGFRGELTWAEAGGVTMADFAPPQPPEGWKVLGLPPSLPAADVPCATELPSTSQNCCPPRRFRFRRGHCR